MKRVAIRQTAFTIVELMVVIVVIAILAGLALVNYNNVKERGYDAAVQSDLSGAADLFESFRVNSSDDHEFPRNKSPDLESLSLKATKNAYDQTTTVNFVYCVNNADFQNFFSLVGLSKSGKVFMITQDGFKPTTLTKASFSNSSTVCNGTPTTNLVSGGMYAPGSWQDWVNG